MGTESDDMVEWKIYTDFASVQDTWREILTQVKSPTVFLEPAFQESWWGSNGSPKLFFIAVQEEQRPIGLLPLVKVGTTLQFLGDESVSDYLDALITPDKEVAAFTGFRQALEQQSGWNTLQLISLPEDSLALTQLPQLAKAADWQFKQTQQDVCPIIELPASWDEYLAQVGKKQRHEIKRKWQRLEEKGQVTFRVVTDTIAEPTALANFFKLHAQSSLEKAQFWTPAHRQFFELMSATASRSGWLRLYFLDFNGQPAACMYCFDYGDSLLIYNSGFDAATYGDVSIGHVITAYTIQDAIAQGKKRYDFLRGGEEYKLRYRPITHPVFNVSLERASDS